MKNPEREKTLELIRTLSSDLKPKGSLHFSFVFLSWIGLFTSVGLLGFAVSFLIQRSVFPQWWPEPVLIAVWGIFTAYLLSKSAFPEENSTWILWGSAAVILIWAGHSMFRFFEEFSSASIHIGLCPLLLGFLSSLIGILGWGIARKMAGSSPKTSAFLFFSFGLAASNFCIQFICPAHDSPHLFFSHTLSSLIWILVLWVPFQKKFVW